MIRDRRRACRVAGRSGSACRGHRGRGGRAFCAGGDIRAVRDASLAGRHDESSRSSRTNTRSTRRSRTTRSRSWPWSTASAWAAGSACRCMAPPGSRPTRPCSPCRRPASRCFPTSARHTSCRGCAAMSGMYMALTGARLHGADAAFVGLATHFTDRETFAALAGRVGADGVAALAAVPPVRGADRAHMPAIDRCFGADSVGGIVERLAATDTEWSRQTLRPAQHVAERGAVDVPYRPRRCVTHVAAGFGGRTCVDTARDTASRLCGRGPGDGDRQGPGTEVVAGNA